MSDSRKRKLLSSCIVNSRDSIFNSFYDGHHSKFTESNFIFEADYRLQSAQKYISFPGKHQVEFPVQTLQPKVQTIQKVPLKELPRAVRIDRLRRQYSKLRISELLEKAGILSENLFNPEDIQEKSHIDAFFENIRISLHFFDEDSFDTNTSIGWLNRGLIDGVRHPMPAWAFIRTSSGVYSWEMVAVYTYDLDSLLFNIIDLKEAQMHKIYRIYLMFMAENPYCFLERIKSALLQRSVFESNVRYQTLLDCALFDRTPKMDQSLLFNQILKLSFVNDVSFEDPICQSICDEIRIQYQRVMVSFELQAFLRNHSIEFPSVGVFQTKPKLYVDQPHISTTDEIKNLTKCLRGLTLFYTSESIQAMMSAVVECMRIESFSLFTYLLMKSVSLSEFVSIQEGNSSTTINYLKYSWPENLSAKICIRLRSIGKGWLDLSVSDWNVFKVAKIFRFFLQTKFRMQEALQILLEKSITSYSHLLNNPCLDFLDIQSDYVWTNDLLKTPFNRLNLPPVFRIVLQVNCNGPFYSTDPTEFEPTVTKLLYTTLMSTCGIRIIEPDSLLNLSFDKNLYIYTVELIENMYIEHVNRLHASYSKAVIPLNAYLQKYECFVEFHEMVVDEYIQEFAQSEKSSQEFRSEIIWQKEQKEYLRAILPESIVIGPFDIYVEPLKKYLVNKRIEIIRKLFLYYVERMLKINEDILDQLLEIDRKLNEKLLSIEHLFEVKDFMQLVPDKLIILRERIQIMIIEYNILDSFFYNLSDQQFAMKWEAFGWPHKIMKRLIVMKEEHKIDIEEFRRIQIRELASFQERLESLNEEIMTFSLHFDHEKALEVAVEAKKTWKLITELQTIGNLLKQRQILFEDDELSLDYLEGIIDSFNPYRIMWNACSDFIKLEEITIGNPITAIDLNDIKQNVAELTRILESSVEIFNEKPDTQNIALVYLNKIKEFRPIYETIECIKNENWLLTHWQEFSHRSGIDIKFSIAMNFGYCIKKGILDHSLLVKEIAAKAVLEAGNIRMAMEEEERLRKEAELALLERKKNRKCRTDIL
ncbi:dynein axonemal heavy chain 1 [Eupeodes corollae]|uniref:dynein axonemal heavy chain 1 n=1 Tax=Eupeodes corollae TaxID=290404 RepID=UPI00248F6874|nr:dynein axonemal heavy chain 1 [Eupeodes corollae]